MSLPSCGKNCFTLSWKSSGGSSRGDGSVVMRPTLYLMEEGEHEGSGQLKHPEEGMHQMLHP